MPNQRQTAHRWWGASLFLPLLLTSATASAPEARATLEEGNAAGLFRRLAAPLAAAMAEPNVMAMDASEQARQVVRALERDQEKRALRRRQDEEQARRPEIVIEVRATATPAAGLAAREPIQTAPPSLQQRQNDDSGQIAALSEQIQSLSLVASSISQASRSVSQTSQQLAQQVTQLSQSTDRLSQSIDSLSQVAQAASQSAQQAQQSAQQAQQSASSAISAAESSAASSASSVIASNLASITSSAANIIAAASASALNIANVASSQVQSAQADATIARADAASQVQKAQGTAVSVTQAALAIVGTFFGSSLLTIAAFYFILKFKNKRRRTRLIATRGISYPKQQDDEYNNSNETGAYGYPIDLKDPPRRSQGGGYGGGGDNNRVTFDEKRDQESIYPRDSQLSGGGAQSPEGDRVASKGMGGAGFGFASFGSGSGSSLSGVDGFNGRKDSSAAGNANSSSNNNNNANGTSFSLFPKTPTSGEMDRGDERQRGPASPSIYRTGNSAVTSNTLAQASTTVNNPTRPPPSLQQWLREGTVSPFGTLRRDAADAQMRGANGSGSNAKGNGEAAAAAASTTNWPFERRQQQLRAMMKRTIGVGGVNAGGGSVMQPGGTLPLRR